ncbi:MAG TPA: hypothetical protein VE866_12105 [Candidatus Binatia bacterium]|nr:hypothetical protein [Candidatus Binatia bacterium]
MTIHELARYYLQQKQTVRAVGLMLNLIKTEPTGEPQPACGHLHGARFI